MQRNSKHVSLVKSDGRNRKKKPQRVNYTRASDLRVRNRNPSRFDVYGAAGMQAMRDINTLRRFINTEVHYTDAVANGQASTTTPSFTLLNGIQTGDTATTRTGISIKCSNISLRYFVYGNASANWISGRILIVQDKQPNGAIFVIGDLLNATTATSPYNVTNQMRFAVLFDDNYVLSFGGNSAIINNLTVACSSHTEYNTGNAGTVADINTNSIYLVHFSDQATNNPAVTWYARYWFIDN